MSQRRLRADLGPLSPGGRFARRLRAADALLYEEIARAPREADLEERSRRALAAAAARDEDGRAMSDAELRDELFTMLGAGHETTATGLAFAFDLLLRNPRRARAPARGARRRRRRRLPRGRREGDAAPAAGDRRRRAHADRAAHRRRLGAAGRRQGLPGDRARAHARGPLSRRARVSPERFLDGRRRVLLVAARSAAASAAASARRSRRPRWPRSCAIAVPAVELRPLRDRPTRSCCAASRSRPSTASRSVQRRLRTARPALAAVAWG